MTKRLLQPKILKRSERYDIDKLRSALKSAFPDGLVEPDHTPTEHWYVNTKNGRRAASVTTKQSVVGKGYLKQWAVNRALDHVSQNRARFIAGDEEVLKEAAMAHTNELESAGSIGTTSHSAFDATCKEWIETGKRPGPTMEKLAPGARLEEVAACRSFDKFLDENEVFPVASETKVWYERGNDCYAGTIDGIFLAHRVHLNRAGEIGCTHDYVLQTSGTLWCTRCGRNVKRRLLLTDWKTSNQISNKDEYAEQAEAYGHAVEAAVGRIFDEIWIVRFSKLRAEYEIMRVPDRKSAWQRFLATSRLFDRRLELPGPLLEPLDAKLVIQI